MAVYDGVPSIRLEGDREKALALVPDAKVFLQQVQAFTKSAGVPTFSSVRRVDDLSYIYVLCAEGLNVIQISVAPQVVDAINKTEEQEEVLRPKFPNFLSGLVFDGVIETYDPPGSAPPYTRVKSFAPTPNCATVHKLQTGKQPNRRLSVRPDASFPEWGPPDDAPLVYSQYVKPRASQWSGQMKKVVQVVMGLGRMSEGSFIDPYGATTKTSAYAKRVSGTGIQVAYDYKFARTHGVVTASDGIKWLVEISITRGVVAMQLPMFPSSTTEKYKARAQLTNDNALFTALEEIGGLPTGESFPTSEEEFNKKLVSGDILQLISAADMQEFYKCSGFSSACGWAFSDDGSEAHNVGYYYPEGEVFQKSVWYQISIQIGVSHPYRLKNTPLAPATATLRKQNEGYLYTPNAPLARMPLKYHEPLIGGLLSHSAKPIGPTTTVPDCDSPVFVAIVDGDLKVARFFMTAKSDNVNETTDDRGGGECLLDGTWTWTQTTGTRTLPSMVYTNDDDNREILDSSFTTTTLTSTSKGYGSPRFSDYLQAPDYCFIWREKTYEQKIETETRSGEFRGAMFIVPGYSREAYYYFEGSGYSSGRSGSTSVSYQNIRDPNVGYGWRKFVSVGAAPWPSGLGCATGNCGGKHSQRRVMCLQTLVGSEQGVGGNMSGCLSYADNGPWMSECDDVVSLCAGAPQVFNGYSTLWDNGMDFTGSMTLRMPNMPAGVRTDITYSQYQYSLLPSPDPETNDVQQIYAVSSGIGDACSIYHNGFLGGDTIAVTNGYVPEPVTGSSIPTFIGVNQP